MDVRNQFNEEDENRCLEEEFREGGNPRATLTSFDLESASVTGSREGSIVSGVTVTTMGGRRRKTKKEKSSCSGHYRPTIRFRAYR